MTARNLFRPRQTLSHFPEVELPNLLYFLAMRTMLLMLCHDVRISVDADLCCVCVCVCVCVYVLVCVGVCMSWCVNVCTRAHVCVRECVCARV